MFLFEFLGRLAMPEILAGLAAFLTALGPAVLAFGKRRELRDSDEPAYLNSIRRTVLTPDPLPDQCTTRADDHSDAQTTTSEKKQAHDATGVFTTPKAGGKVGELLKAFDELSREKKASEPLSAATPPVEPPKKTVGEFTATFGPPSVTVPSPYTQTLSKKPTGAPPQPSILSSPMLQMQVSCETAALKNPGSRMLICYAVVLVVFGAFAAIHYWDAIKQRQDLAFTMVGLLLTMVAGMFVQVITCNYRASAPLFHVTASQLAYPLLFSPIVFYPVWALTTGGSQHLFAFYAAFLDGFFWESVVSSAKSVTVETPNGNSGPRRRRRKLPVTPQPA